MSVARVAEQTLRQSRRGLLGWLVGIAAMTALYAASYKSIAGVKAAAIANYPDALKRALNLQDLTSPAGYLNSTVFGIPLLLLVTIYVISAATRAVAGDEESGALDLLLAYPVSRTSLVLARMCSMVAVLIGMGLVVFAVLLMVRGPVGLSVSASHLAAVTVMWILLGCCLGSIALLVSAWVGRRSATLAISAGIALLAYLADSFLPLIKHFSWIGDISPYRWFTGGNPLSNGIQAGDCALMLATALVATTLAIGALNRRDLHV
jgi:ABC-2 type transport system permease protein